MINPHLSILLKELTFFAPQFGQLFASLDTGPPQSLHGFTAILIPYFYKRLEYNYI